jgi:MYXO-CTERM domain-containing protein
MALRLAWSVFVIAPLLLLVEGVAGADSSVSFGPGLRPYVHTDRRGYTLVDVCPERIQGQRRCHLQRLLQPGDPLPIPLSGGLGGCTAMMPIGRARPPPGSMTPADVLSAYNLPATASASGAIVAIVDLPSTNAMLDVNTYRAYFGIPALPACPVDSTGVPAPGGVACFARVGGDGTVNSLSSTNCPGSSQETSLDIEMVSAVCPDCSIVVVESPNADVNLDMMSAIAAPPSCPGGVIGALAVSTSWGGPEGAHDDDSYFACPSILTLTSAGDTGYMLEDDVSGKGAADFPASSPYVIAVGGTTLTPSSEDVWDDDGMWGGGGSTTSGCSREFAMPSYQSASGFGFGPCKMRAANDVSAAAEWYGGGGGAIAVYNEDSGGWAAVTGTSASSPLVAGIMVRLGLGGKDQHALFYANGGAFDDITTGNDDSAGICGGTVMCTAGKRWDGPSGLGSPNGPRLLALAGGTLEPEPDAGFDSGPPADAGRDSGAREDSGSDAGSHKAHHGGDAAPPAPDASAGNQGPNGSSSGCACSAAKSRSSRATTAWLTLGLLALTRRRRK